MMMINDDARCLKSTGVTDQIAVNTFDRSNCRPKAQYRQVGICQQIIINKFRF